MSEFDLDRDLESQWYCDESSILRQMWDATPPTVWDFDVVFARTRPKLRLSSFLHRRPERAVDSGLVAPALFFEPGEDVGVQTQSDRLFQRPVVPRPLRPQIPRKLLPVCRSPQPGNLPAFLYRFSLLHSVAIST